MFKLDDILGGRFGRAILPIFLVVMNTGWVARGLARQVRRRIRPREQDLLAD